MLRKSVQLGIATSLVLTLAACGSSTKDNSNATTASPKSTAASTNATPAASANPNDEAFQISVAHWILGSSNAYAEQYMKNVEALYKKKYPNATIKWNPIQGEKYHELLKAQLATGSAPDVFFHQNALVPFAKAGYLTDLSDQPWASKIMASTKPDNEFQGKVYAAPVDVSGWGIFYNKKVFSDAGLTVPKNYQEFLDDSEKLKNAGVIPVTAGFKDGWPISGTWISLASFVYGANKNVAKDLYDSKTKVNGPEFKALFDGFTQMVQKGYLSKSVLSTGYDTAVQQVGEGKAAMMFNGPWMNSVVADKYKVDLGFFPLPDPQGNDFVTTATNASLSLNAKYPNKQRGIDMINALIDSSTLPGLLQNSAFTGLPNITIPQNTSGGKDYAGALSKYDSQMQMTLWLPPSAQDALSSVITKIAAGKSYTAADLDAVDQAYQRDKGLVNLP
ncbi:hypothetical protein A8709_11055 [Paenibacillus pectinilyticus]|uniref:ABC transporter substrate-binding protein n=1 Tax=Paenibacillus pectinilyticus TaxID=512399 RepID=A0A1C1A2N5_9BACL|nr:extracellular solute-binding protein [Paenibacillus pectinilyticus]OCT14713.1 hypothetical protein A8709_11055 [Paenibacillus pectinilyticus]